MREWNLQLQNWKLIFKKRNSSLSQVAKKAMILTNIAFNSICQYEMHHINWVFSIEKNIWLGYIVCWIEHTISDAKILYHLFDIVLLKIFKLISLCRP